MPPVKRHFEAVWVIVLTASGGKTERLSAETREKKKNNVPNIFSCSEDTAVMLRRTSASTTLISLETAADWLQEDLGQGLDLDQD